jgi:hypothetical protein
MLCKDIYYNTYNTSDGCKDIYYNTYNTSEGCKDIYYNTYNTSDGCHTNLLDNYNIGVTRVLAVQQRTFRIKTGQLKNCCCIKFKYIKAFCITQVMDVRTFATIHITQVMDVRTFTTIHITQVMDVS